ncbi:MAG: TonB-dependent receptor [Pseudomonadota bacterium]
MPLKRLSAIFLLLFHGPFAFAQSSDSGAEDFFEDTPLVLTASRMSKPLLESPASVSIIDRQMIENSGVREIADLFRFVPGFVVGYHSGHAPAVTYHGLGQEFARHLQVLVDGRSVFIPSFGGVPWSNLPLLIEDIERIEIIRGPNAVTYGANAFLATINIITRHAAEDRGSRFSVTASDNANPDIEDAYLRIGSHHETVDWRLSLATVNDEGFNDIHDSKRIGKINFRADIQATDNQYWTLQTGTSNSVAGRGLPRTSDNQTDIERNEEAENRYINIQWEGIWDSSSTIARLTNTRQEVTDNYDPGPFTFNGFSGVTTFIDFDRTSDRSDFELIHRDDISDNLRLVYGGSIRRDKVKTLFLLNSDSFETVDTERIFAALEWRLAPDWLLDIGVMSENSDLTERKQSPRTSLIYKLSDRHALRFVASTARRNPILAESQGETEFVANIPPFGDITVPTLVGNDQLEPEKIESLEIGLRSQFSRSMSSDFKLFSYRIEDLILNATTPVDAGFPLGVLDVPTLVNDSSIKVNGAEFDFQFPASSRLDIHVGASVVNVDTDEEDLEESFPDYTGFVQGNFQINERQLLSVSFFYLDNISWLDSQRDTTLSRRLDLNYQYRINDQFIVSVIGQNLLEDFEDYESENIHDQVYYLRVSGGF